MWSISDYALWRDSHKTSGALFRQYEPPGLDSRGEESQKNKSTDGK